MPSMNAAVDPLPLVPAIVMILKGGLSEKSFGKQFELYQVQDQSLDDEKNSAI